MKRKLTTTLRFAEKKRQRSCLFADVVANRVLEAFKKYCPTKVFASFSKSNTVLSAFLLLNEKNLPDDKKLRVLSIGVGTTFVKLPEKDNKHQIRDCHAEILARKGLKRFLAQVIANNKVSEFFIREENKRFQLKSHLELVFYSSSAPCGNSVIKRWAKGSKEKENPLFVTQSYEYPVMPHSPILLQSLKQGQIAPMIKTNLGPQVKLKSDRKNPTATEMSTAFCSGTQTEFSKETKSCSFKIAKWNLFGVQGKLLLRYFEPLYFSVAVIGRKFSRPHLRRALCCRLQDWDFQLRSYSQWKGCEEGVVKRLAQFRVNHPTFLCTQVKVDNGVIQQTTQANFCEDALGLVFVESQPEVFLMTGNQPKRKSATKGNLSLSALEECLGTSSADAEGMMRRDCNVIFQRLKMFQVLAPERGN